MGCKDASTSSGRMRCAFWISLTPLSHLGARADLFEQASQPLPGDRVHQHWHLLKHTGPSGVLEMLHALPLPNTGAETFKDHLQYLEKACSAHGLPNLSTTGLADRVRQCRECEPTRDASPAQRLRHALGAQARYSSARLTDGPLS
jgi:hypothetical protein